MNQAAKQEELNDALVPGTFGGDALTQLKKNESVSDNIMYEDRHSNSNSYYQKTSTNNREGPSMSITGSDGMLSFNPSNLSRMPANNASLINKGEAPPMSFGGTTLNDMIRNEA
jgi:hypothetical protein